MANKETKIDWVQETLAECEKDRKNRRMPEEEYYYFRLEELAKELPEKPFGSKYVPAEVKQLKQVTKTVYVARPGINYCARQQIRY